MNSTLELLGALLQFFILSAVVAVLAWLTTRFVGTRMGATGRGRPLRVLHHIPAGRDRSVMLMEVGGRLYLVGATSQHVNLLDLIDDPETIARIMAQIPDADEQPLAALLPGSFTEALGKAVKRFAGRGGQETPADSPPPEEPTEAGRLREQIERLRRMQKE